MDDHNDIDNQVKFIAVLPLTRQRLHNDAGLFGDNLNLSYVGLCKANKVFIAMTAILDGYFPFYAMEEVTCSCFEDIVQCSLK